MSPSIEALFPSSSASVPPAPPPRLTRCDHLKNIIKAIALTIFYAFAFWNCPYFFTVNFFVGIFFSAEVKKRITDVFNQMAWRWIVPTSMLLYWLSLPATLTMQAVIAGLDMGARWSFAARGMFQDTNGRWLFCFRV